MSREAMQMALEALEEINKLSIGENAICLPAEIDGAMDALRERLAQPVREPVDSPEKAGAYMDARLWEFIDMAAAWPEAKTDTRTWDHVLVYAPKQLEQEPVAWRYALDASVDGPRWVYIDKDPHQWLKGPSLGHALIESLYTSQPKREWVGLTADEIWKCNKASGSAVEFHICYAHQNVEDFAEAIEAKLKEKNT